MDITPLDVRPAISDLGSTTVKLGAHGDEHKVVIIASSVPDVRPKGVKGWHDRYSFTIPSNALRGFAHCGSEGLATITDNILNKSLSGLFYVESLTAENEGETRIILRRYSKNPQYEFMLESERLRT